MCVFLVCHTAAKKKKKACCVAAALLSVTYYLPAYHMCMKTQLCMNTHVDTHTHTSQPLLPSCEGFDIRLPAADAAAAAANANAAQGLKHQRKTATNITQRRLKLHTAEELSLVR